MARVHFVKKARKDQKEAGIKKGDSYYWWEFKFAGKHVSKTPPRRSQLTQSSFLSQMYDIEDVEISGLTITSDFESDVQSIIDSLENLRSECEDKLSNMPEQLQSAPTGEMLQNRIDSVQEMIDELEGIDKEVDEEDIKSNVEKEEDETDEDYNTRQDDAVEEKRQEILDEIQAVTYNGE
jgi:hypothetical protein